MMLDLETIKSMLDDIDNTGRLSEWEIEFVDQMLKLTDKGASPSEKQVAVIVRMFEKL